MAKPFQEMTLEDVFELARQMAVAKRERAADTDTNNTQEQQLPSASSDISSRTNFLHDNEVKEALRVISQVAAGRNPFVDEPFDRLRPEHRDLVLRALCCVLSVFTVSTLEQIARRESFSQAAPHPTEPSTLLSADLSQESVAAATEPWAKLGLETFLDGIERQAILKALEVAKWNKTLAAKLLRVTFRALRYRMERLGIE